MAERGAEPTRGDSAQVLARRLWRRGHLIVVGGIGGVLGLVNEVASATASKGSHPFHVPVWVWVTLLVGGFGIAVVMAFHDERVAQHRLTTELVGSEKQAHASTQNLLSTERIAHDRTKAQLNRLTETPVPPEHRERVLEVARHARASVDKREQTNYSDGRTDSRPDHAKLMLQGHYAGLVGVLDAWDARIWQRDFQRHQLELWIAAQVKGRGMNVPPWHEPQILDAFRAHIDRCELLEDSPLPEPDIQVLFIPTLLYWGWVQGGNVWRVLSLDDKATDTADRLRDLFRDVRDSEDFSKLRGAWSDLTDFQAKVRSELSFIELHEHTYGQCVACHPNTGKGP